MTDKENSPATLDDILPNIIQIQSLLEDISAWLKLISAEKIKNILEEELDSPRKKLVYHYSTEDKSTRTISDLSTMSRGSISNYQKSWYNIGLMKKIQIQGKERYVKNFDLEDYKINVLNNKSNAQQTTETETSFSSQKTVL